MCKPSECWALISKAAAMCQTLGYHRINTMAQDTELERDEKIATGAGHHSVMNIPGTDEWFIVYHRRPIPNLDRDHRVVCIDRLFFDKKGDIKNVKMTFAGVKRPLK